MKHACRLLSSRLSSRPTRRVLGTLAATSIVALAAASASSQPAQGAPQTLRPPTVNQTDDPPTIRLYLVTALLGALVVGANLIPSKRGHQD